MIFHPLKHLPPRSPNSEIELGEIVEPVEAVEMDPEPEQLMHNLVDAEHPHDQSYTKNQDFVINPGYLKGGFPNLE